MTKTIKETVKCSRCDGDGFDRYSDNLPFGEYCDTGCTDCGGSGSYQTDTSYNYRHDKPKQDLRKGSGKVINEYEVSSETCGCCSGDKYIIYWNSVIDQLRYNSILGSHNLSPPTTAQIREAEAFLRSNSRKETCKICRGTGFRLNLLRSRPFKSGW